MKRNVASQVIGAELVSKTDGSAVTTGTTTCYVTGDNGTQAAGSVSSGAATHKGNGLWTYAPAQAETDYAHVAFTFVNTAAVNASIQVFPSFPQTGDNFVRLGAPAGASVSADVAAVKSDSAAIKAKTDNLPSSPAAVADVPTANAVADAILARNIAGGSSTGRLVKDALRTLRNKTAISGGTLTVYEEDDLTPAWTAAVTTTPGDPLSAIDPA